MYGLTALFSCTCSPHYFCSPHYYYLLLLTATFIPTPIGRLFAIADDNGLYLLEFDNRRGLEKEIERLRIKRQARIIAGNNAILTQLTNELALYFSGKSATFTIPLCLMGTPFQKDVWALLQKYQPVKLKCIRI
ncbi:methylated-DNA--[protein]-cysteine S-methyltransferase [Streptococcus pluranimalium]